MEANTARKKPTKLDEMTKEQIRQAIIKKRECNSQAQNIVENLLEQDIKADYFIKCLPNINQSHFEDVIEERSIINLCGYPMCRNTLSVQNIPKQKYRISLKSNKVYDITARKSFCSNCCYKAAVYVKNQLLTSPLWFREYEDLPKINLLPLDSKGSMGQEVDVSLLKKVSVKEKKFLSANDFANASLNKITDNNNVLHPNADKVSKHCDPYNENSIESNKKLQTSEFDAAKSLKKDCLADKININTPKIKNMPSNPINIVGDIIEKPEKKMDPILKDIPSKETTSKPTKSSKKILERKQQLLTTLTIEVEKTLAEWFTLDTMLLLFGKERVKEMVDDKGECIKEYLNNISKSIFYNSTAYDQYQQLCRKLNMLELEDRCTQKTGETSTTQETKPLPDYSILHKESKKMQLKVRSYFAGETTIPDVESYDTIPVPTDDVDGNLTKLPLVDKNAQNAHRRRIVCSHLNKVLPDLLQSLSLLNMSISSDVRLLVNTLKLRANNIMFKPIQWTLIAIVFIKLLSIRDKRLEYLLQQPRAFQHMQLLLLSYKQDGGYLDRLISWLTDIDRLLDTTDKQLTIE